MPWRFLRMEEHFELINANFIRCEECNENFFFDFLRHPRYFVTHFKTCHLKNLLYRFNGHSEEENQKTRFGPRRKRDANTWFGQLKSTEKRMISMQDNKWSEITESECWSCRLCNDGKADLTHVFELNELGRGQAFLHLRQFHEAAYEAFLRSLPDIQNTAAMSGDAATPGTPALPTTPSLAEGGQAGGEPASTRTVQQRIAEAERSRLRRMRATPEEKQSEAERSKRRRDNLTPSQRQADYERRKRKKKRVEESVRSKKRREEASDEMKRKEVLRSRERRRNATEEQRQREALRSRMRRENASDDQKIRERERCRKRYEAKKEAKHHTNGMASSASGTDDGGTSTGHYSDSAVSQSVYTPLPPEHPFLDPHSHSVSSLERSMGAPSNGFLGVPQPMNTMMLHQQMQNHPAFTMSAPMGMVPVAPSMMMSQESSSMANTPTPMPQASWSSLLHSSFPC